MMVIVSNVLKVSVNKIFACFLFLVFLSCNTEKKEGGDYVSSKIPEYKLEIGERNEIADLSEFVSKLRMIKLSSEVANEVGMIFHFAVVDSNSIVLVDEITGKINRINSEGEIVWQISAKTDDYRFHNVIEGFSYDSHNKQIVIYDESQIFRYSLTGEPVEVKGGVGFDFHQLTYCSNGDALYSIQGFQNVGLSDSPKQLVWMKNGRMERTFVEGLFRAPGNMLVGGFNEFNRLNGMLHYHASFRDTFYHVNLPSVNPSFTFNFSVAETTNDVMDLHRIENKLRHVFSREIPLVYNLAADVNNLALSYQKGEDHFLGLLNRENEKWLVNHQYLRYDGILFRAPLLYNDGFFLRMIPQYQVEHYAKLSEQATILPQAWKEELEKLDNRYDELGSKTIFLVEL